MMLSTTNAFAYSDCPATNPIGLLSELGVVSGFEDGTFRPLEKVTRAQAVKMMVLAYGDNIEVPSDTKVEFFDVDPSYWGYEYIKKGVAYGMINGFEDGTFRPDEIVTVEQAAKILVNMLGDETSAMMGGGYPTGYMSEASKLGILVDMDINEHMGDTLVRAKIAEMIYAALHAPMWIVVDMRESFDHTQTIPVYEERNGVGEGYQTILTYNFNIYEATGIITANSDGSAAFEIQEARNFCDKQIESSAPVAITMKADKTITEKYNGKLCTAYIKHYKDTDNYELVYTYEKN